MRDNEQFLALVEQKYESLQRTAQTKKRRFRSFAVASATLCLCFIVVIGVGALFTREGSGGGTPNARNGDDITIYSPVKSEPKVISLSDAYFDAGDGADRLSVDSEPSEDFIIFDPDTERIVRDNANQPTTVKLCGKEIPVGRYLCTLKKYDYPSAAQNGSFNYGNYDVYINSFGQFLFFADSEILCGYRYFDGERINAGGCSLEFADAVARDILPDGEAAKYTVSETVDGDGNHVFEYRRVIFGVKTDDLFRITLTENGDLQMIEGDSMLRFSSVAEKITQSVIDDAFLRTAEATDTIKSTVRLFSVGEVLITMNADGEPICFVDVEYYITGKQKFDGTVYIRLFEGGSET